MCADEVNTVKCNRGHLRQWEKFKVVCVSGCGEEKKLSLEEKLGEATEAAEAAAEALKAGEKGEVRAIWSHDG